MHSLLPAHGVPPAAIGFRPEFLDFRRGIRVGKLEEHERITRILKLVLEAEFGEPFVTERWGRGMYWQWIGYLPRGEPRSQAGECSSQLRLFEILLNDGYRRMPVQVRHAGRARLPQSPARIPRVRTAARLGLASTAQ